MMNEIILMNAGGWIKRGKKRWVVSVRDDMGQLGMRTEITDGSGNNLLHSLRKRR